MTIPNGKTFLLQPLSFNGPCKPGTITIEIKGSITAPKDVKLWKFSSDRKNVWIRFSEINDLIVNGKGDIDGQGSSWWLRYPGDQDRPTALQFLGCQDLKLNDLTHRNSPRNHISIDTCKGAFISNLHIIAAPTSPNTDGIDISQSSNVFITNSFIGTGDDCIAINSGSRFINITGVFCGPGHGISVGSLGKNGAFSTVEQVYVRNCTFTRTSNGARIKTFTGGSGYARNIKYEDITLVEVENPVYINQNYIPVQDSAVEVSDVTFSNIHGTSTGKYAVELLCEPNIGCTDIVLNNINIKPISGGEALVSCSNAHGRCTSCVPNVLCLSQNNGTIVY
ncbi:probable polygalacturonase At3g15720 [Medicago truncatula]|nr:probable polygalacturonase At3g15720 [Medicago truncatula]